MQKEWLYGTYWKFRLISRANTWFTAGINDGFYNSYMLSTGPCMKEVLSVPLFATRGIKQAFVMKHKTIWFEIWRGCKVSTYDSIVVAARFFLLSLQNGVNPIRTCSFGQRCCACSLLLMGTTSTSGRGGGAQWVCVSEKEQSRRSRPGLPGGRAYGFASPHSPNKYSWIRAPNIRIPRHPLGLIDAVKPGGSQSSQFLASGMAASRYWRELDRIKSRRLKLTTMISEWQKSETRVSV